MSDMSQRMAYEGDNKELFGNVDDADTGSYTTIVTHTVTTGKTFYITDMKFSADTDGIVRMKYDGNVCCMQFYAARDCLDCARNMPFKAASAKVVLIEYKPDSDNAKAAANIGGYEVD